VGAGPVGLVIFLASVHLAVKLLALPAWAVQTCWTILVLAWSLVGAIFVARLINGVLVHYVRRYAVAKDDALIRQMVQMLRSVVGVAVWLVAILFAIANLGFNVSSLLAGLGLGGLALAMASKDTLSNIFGAFTILINGPFRVGDVIKYQGHTGTVEQVSLRDTRIRTFEGHLVTVPNAMAPTSVVENISARPRFRVLFKLGLEYGTDSPHIDQAGELVKQAIASQEGVAEDVLVHFVDFAESAVEVQVIYYIEDMSRILDIRHAVNQQIKTSLDQAHIAFAFKTITVHNG
jgi:MscS family membrane protein